MELLIRNADVLKIIFQYLKLEEQIIAAQVCREFQYIIVKYMWRYKYRHLNAYKLNANTFIINKKQKSSLGDCEKGVNEYFVDLKRNEFQTFLKLNQENVTELELCDYTSTSLKDMEEFTCNNRWKFAHLELLILHFVKLDTDDLRMIFKNCKKLETLRLKQCQRSNFDLITMRDHDNCNYEILLKIIKTLKEFQMEYFEVQFQQSYLSLCDFYDLLLNNNLKYLNLNVPLSSLRCRETPRLHNNSCEALQIGIFSEYKCLKRFTRFYLSSFKNLLHLTVEGSVTKICIDSQFVKHLSASCPLIKHLNFKRCLINVSDFSLLSSIMEIKLDNCISLTWRNLKQLLELPHLLNLHTNNSTYTKEFENIAVPAHLESLTLVGNEFKFAQIFEKPEEQLKNLKKLIYYDGSDAKIIGIPHKFPNLETLHILPHHLEVKDLFQLNALKTFKVPGLIKSQEDFVKVMHLISHPILRQFSVIGEGIHCSEMPIHHSNVKLTKLACLTLNLSLFNNMLEFWLDLLNDNIHLKIVVVSEDAANVQYYTGLVQHDKFLKKSIKVCGFEIDCAEFINHPKVVEKKLDLIRQLAEFKNVYFII